MGVTVTALIFVMGVFFVWALVAGRLARWSVTAPLAMAAAGTVLTAGTNPVVIIELETQAAEHVVEIVLALVLFIDATEVPREALRREGRRIPVRLLGIALPLSLILAWLAGIVFFSSENLWLLAVLAAVVVPIDLAPAAAILREKRVPRPLRDALNVESGINDGIVAPIFLWCVAGALATAGEGDDQPIGTALLLGLPVLATSVAVGVVIGFVGGKLLVLVHRNAWTEASALRIGVLALPFTSYGVAVLLDGNGFVAAFVTGVTFAHFARLLPNDALHLSEDFSTMMTLILWFVFGQVVTDSLEQGGLWGAVPYALVALTIVRIVPVAISLIGTRLSGKDMLFLGWMGPRGLASIVFGLLAYIQLAGPESELVGNVMVVTVALSVVLHGLSTRLVGAWYEPREKSPTVPTDPS
jgi:sodium/hydrogen antiporter